MYRNVRFAYARIATALLFSCGILFLALGGCAASPHTERWNEEAGRLVEEAAKETEAVKKVDKVVEAISKTADASKSLTASSFEQLKQEIVKLCSMLRSAWDELKRVHEELVKEVERNKGEAHQAVVHEELHALGVGIFKVFAGLAVSAIGIVLLLAKLKGASPLGLFV